MAISEINFPHRFSALLPSFNLAPNLESLPLFVQRFRTQVVILQGGTDGLQILNRGHLDANLRSLG